MGAEPSTIAIGSGNGGNITIDAGGFVLAILPENSDIAATAIQGRGGNIFVTAQGVFGFSLPERLVRTPESDISAASQLGINGTREIDTGNNLQLVTLPDDFTSPAIAQECQGTDGDEAASGFVITGRGGKPSSPSDPLNNNTGWVDSRAIALPAENPSDTAKQPPQFPEIVEAKGWIVNPNGQIELVAEMPTLTAYNSWSEPVSCNQGMSNR
ncbi:MAG: S-layer family protein [Symploca sp. SIO2E6]|nr:S-layer family protein [Symploca sp. SIO2E6]